MAFASQSTRLRETWKADWKQEASLELRSDGIASKRVGKSREVEENDEKRHENHGKRWKDGSKRAKPKGFQALTPKHSTADAHQVRLPLRRRRSATSAKLRETSRYPISSLLRRFRVVFHALKPVSEPF